MAELLIAVVLGLVEGLTEFVPVSSTGHLILVGQVLGFEGERAATFQVFIQLGAILAVAVLYPRRLRDLANVAVTQGFAGRRGLGLLMLTTLPALGVGATTHGLIKSTLFDAKTVTVGLVLGGLAILAAERWRPRPTTSDLDALRWQEALAVGAFQCLALWPGVSRSAATIVGGMLVGVERKTAAEYSFLAALPVMAAATSFDLLVSLPLLTSADIPIFAIGFVVSFGTAWVAITYFLRLLTRVTLRPFAWYRIGLAMTVLMILVRIEMQG